MANLFNNGAKLALLANVWFPASDHSLPRNRWLLVVDSEFDITDGGLANQVTNTRNRAFLQLKVHLELFEILQYGS